MVRRAHDPYARFAKYYDFIYTGIVDYDGDVDFLVAVFRRWGRGPTRTVLDLGCGTGNHALILARRGLDVTGVDVSRAQLQVARGKARASRLPVRFVQGDFRSFRIPGPPFDAVVCMFGGWGYLLKTGDILRALRAVRGHLRHGGLFAFEFWQSTGVRPPPHQSWLHKVGPAYEIVRTSDSRFDPKTRKLPIEFRFFVFHGRRVLDRFVVDHIVRTYTVPEIRGLLRGVGLRPLAMLAATPQRKAFERVRRETFRVMAIARR